MDKNTLEIIEQIQLVKRRLITSQVFLGYSGWARFSGAFVALVGALILSSGDYQGNLNAHIFGWGSICAIAFCLNIGSVLVWQYRIGRLKNIDSYLPLLDIVAPFFIGAIGTFALISNGMENMLFGFWMCLYGLLHTSTRHTTVKGIYWLGWYYLLSGTYFLLSSPLPLFVEPMPMGVVFFIGELIGAYLFLRSRSVASHE